MIVLTTDRLHVELAEPGESPNSGCRFDRAGFVTEVVLDGDVRYCGTEPKNMAHPSSGGRGFCSEYILDLSSEAKIGDRYPKLGVGLIRKEDDEPYVLHRRYRDVTPFEIDYTCGGRSVVFTTQALPCLGYAVQSEKTVSLEGARMSISVRISNTGEKPFSFREYCHNFISIDGLALSPEYLLRLPEPIVPPSGMLPDKNGDPSAFVSKDGCITFSGYSPFAAGLRLDPLRLNEKEFRWELSNAGARAYVRGVDSFNPTAVSVWYCDHIVSPEIFIAVELMPGQSMAWQRTWEFGRFS